MGRKRRAGRKEQLRRAVRRLYREKIKSIKEVDRKVEVIRRVEAGSPPTVINLQEAGSKSVTLEQSITGETRLPEPVALVDGTEYVEAIRNQETVAGINIYVWSSGEESILPELQDDNQTTETNFPSDGEVMNLLDDIEEWMNSEDIDDLFNAEGITAVDEKRKE